MLTRLDARPKRPGRPGRARTRPAKVPANPARRLGSPRPPAAVEAFYVLALRGWAKRHFAAALSVILPEIGDFVRPAADSSERSDAEDDPPDNRAKAAALVKRAQKKANGAASPNTVGGNASKAAGRAVDHSKKEFKRLGIDIRKEPLMTPLIDGWRKDNVSLITKMSADEHAKVEKILSDGWGRHVKSLQKDIERQFIDVSSSRAELIARDQTLTLNAKINRHRQKAAGIDSYVWTTSNDERVREEHEELEGEEFEWDGDGDPEEGHPGEAINCRCVAFPLVPDLDDDD